MQAHRAPRCQVPGCDADLQQLRSYFHRCKICEVGGWEGGGLQRHQACNLRSTVWPAGHHMRQIHRRARRRVPLPRQQEHHKADMVEVGGCAMRFCHQCAALHPVGAFHKKRRSCIQGLQKRGERRRKRVGLSCWRGPRHV
jgi:hypothetical protein